MRKFLIFIIFLTVTYASTCQVRVSGYFRKNGTYVQPYYRSSPDGNPYNNYSYPGNYNPYTGQYAKGNPDTYLKRYYHIYSDYSPETYSNYIINLCGTNYSGMELSKTYTNKNYENKEIGYIVPDGSDRSFTIYDIDKNKIGYVKLTNNRKRFTVYTIDGEIIASNKKNTGWIILGVALGIGLGALLGTSL